MNGSPLSRSARSAWPRWASMLLLIGLPLLVILAMRLPYFGVATLNEDEGLYAMVARAMLHGGLPYRDAWDHAAPGIFTLYWALFKVFGGWNMDAVRVAALLAHLASSLIVGYAVRRRHGDLAGGVAAALTAVSLGGYLALDAIAALTETFLTPFLLAATVFALRWADGEKPRALLMGILIALAIWFKIHALFLAGAVLLGAGLMRVRQGDNELGVLWTVVRTFLWAFAAYLVLVLPLFLRGGFPAYWHIYIGYNIFYFGVGGYGGPFLSGLVKTAWQWGFPQFVVVALAWAALAASSPARPKPHAARLVLGLALAMGFVVGILGGRLFGHYFLMAAAFAGWLAGEGVGLLLKEWREARWSSVFGWSAILLLAAGLVTPVAVFHYDAWTLRVQGDRDFVNPFRKLTREIDFLLEPDETMWVWGFAPDIYVHAQRDCPTRFINCNYLVGLIPWVNANPHIDTTPYIIKGSWQLLMQDLRAHPPAAIVDAAEADFRFWGKYPMKGSPVLTKFVQDNYYLLDTFDGFPLYLRNDIADREDVK